MNTYTRRGRGGRPAAASPAVTNSFRITSLYDPIAQLPWNHIVAKNRGRGNALEIASTDPVTPIIIAAGRVNGHQVCASGKRLMKRANGKRLMKRANDKRLINVPR